ncbi:MAG: L-threonylcarbamoyladenylate synthase [Promicromonosporaceae bacterium]|nr:L-threonylcarbamoyladenylate synthase [Promicromonosporaceae bacterium]
MTRFFDVHPDNPQPRAVTQIAQMLRDDALIGYPTDSGYALGTRIGYPDGPARIRALRRLGERHHFTLVCADFAQLGPLVHLDNSAFRAIKAATPGPYTFILKATAEVPRRLAHPRKKTVGVRITDNPVAQAILAQLGEPLLSSTLIPPGEQEALTDGWSVKERFDHLLDAVVDGGEVPARPTTVISFAAEYPEVIRVGAGDPDRF